MRKSHRIPGNSNGHKFMPNALCEWKKPTTWRTHVDVFNQCRCATWCFFILEPFRLFWFQTREVRSHSYPEHQHLRKGTNAVKSMEVGSHLTACKIAFPFKYLYLSQIWTTCKTRLQLSELTLDNTIQPFGREKHIFCRGWLKPRLSHGPIAWAKFGSWMHQSVSKWFHPCFCYSARLGSEPWCGQQEIRKPWILM